MALIYSNTIVVAYVVVVDVDRLSFDFIFINLTFKSRVMEL
jgi:hypothetical protein